MQVACLTGECPFFLLAFPELLDWRVKPIKMEILLATPTPFFHLYSTLVLEYLCVLLLLLLLLLGIAVHSLPSPKESDQEGIAVDVAVMKLKWAVDVRRFILQFLMGRDYCPIWEGQSR